MADFKKYNAQNVLDRVQEIITAYRTQLYIPDVYADLSIFDWWKSSLTLSDLKQMRTFLKAAVDLGFTGYVCFKVGAAGCAHGMWAHKEESTNGFSPECDFLYHSFRPGDNFWDAEINGDLLHNRTEKEDLTLAEIKSLLKGAH